MCFPIVDVICQFGRRDERRRLSIIGGTRGGCIEEASLLELVRHGLLLVLVLLSRSSLYLSRSNVGSWNESAARLRWNRLR